MVIYLLKLTGHRGSPTEKRGHFDAAIFFAGVTEHGIFFVDDVVYAEYFASEAKAAETAALPDLVDHFFDIVSREVEDEAPE